MIQIFIIRLQALLRQQILHFDLRETRNLHTTFNLFCFIESIVHMSTSTNTTGITTIFLLNAMRDYSLYNLRYSKG